MTGTIPANGHLLRQRLLDLGISDRQLTKSTGLGPATIRSLTSGGGLAASVTVGTLRRVLDETGLTAADLLDPVDAPQPDGDHDDAQLLAQALSHDERLHPRDRLARALGWTLDRLDQAIDHLDQLLRPAGLTVHVNGMGVTIRPSDARAEPVTARLDRFRDTEEGLDNGVARLLYTALTRGLTKTATRKGDQPAVAHLHRQGVFTTSGSGDGNRLRLSPDALHAFDVD